MKLIKSVIIVLIFNQYWLYEEKQNEVCCQSTQVIIDCYKQVQKNMEMIEVLQLFQKDILKLENQVLSETLKLNLIQIVNSSIYNKKDQNQNFLYDYRFNDYQSLLFQVTSDVFEIEKQFVIGYFVKLGLKKYIKYNLELNHKTGCKYLLELKQILNSLDIQELCNSEKRLQIKDDLNLRQQIQLDCYKQVYDEISYLVQNIIDIKVENEQLIETIVQVYFFSFWNIQCQVQEFEDPYQSLLKDIRICAYQIISQQTRKYKIELNIDNQSVLLEQLFDVFKNVNEEISNVKQVVIQLSVAIKKNFKTELKMSDIQVQIASAFFDTLLEDLKPFLEFYSSKISLIHNKTQEMFNLTFQLSNLDQIIQELMQQEKLNIIDSLGPAIELWVQQVQLENKQIIQKCYDLENYQQTEQCQECTEQCLQFCNLLFKSVEIIKNLISYSKNKLFKQLISNRIEIILHESIIEYITKTQRSLNSVQQYQEITFKPKKQQFDIRKVLSFNQDNSMAINNFNQIKNFYLRLNNMNFINNQIDIILNIVFDRSKIVHDLKQDISTINLKIFRSISYFIINLHFKNIFFDKLYQKLNSKTMEKKGIKGYLQEYKYSVSSLLSEIENYLYLLQQLKTDLIQQNHESYISYFLDIFSLRYLVEVFDNNKIVFINQLNLCELLLTDYQVLIDLIVLIFQVDKTNPEMNAVIDKYQNYIKYYQKSTDELIGMVDDCKNNQDQVDFNICLRILKIRSKNSKQKTDIKNVLQQYSSVY